MKKFLMFFLTAALIVSMLTLGVNAEISEDSIMNNTSQSGLASSAVDSAATGATVSYYADSALTEAADKSAATYAQFTTGTVNNARAFYFNNNVYSITNTDSSSFAADGTWVAVRQFKMKVATGTGRFAIRSRVGKKVSGSWKNYNLYVMDIQTSDGTVSKFNPTVTSYNTSKLTDTGFKVPLDTEFTMTIAVELSTGEIEAYVNTTKVLDGFYASSGDPAVTAARRFMDFHFAAGETTSCTVTVGEPTFTVYNKGEVSLLDVENDLLGIELPEGAEAVLEGLNRSTNNSSNSTVTYYTDSSFETTAEKEDAEYAFVAANEGVSSNTHLFGFEPNYSVNWPNSGSRFITASFDLGISEDATQPVIVRLRNDNTSNGANQACIAIKADGTVHSKWGNTYAFSTDPEEDANKYLIGYAVPGETVHFDLVYNAADAGMYVFLNGELRQHLTPNETLAAATYFKGFDFYGTEGTQFIVGGYSQTLYKENAKTDEALYDEFNTSGKIYIKSAELEEETEDNYIASAEVYGDADGCTLFAAVVSKEDSLIKGFSKTVIADTDNISGIRVKGISEAGLENAVVYFYIWDGTNMRPCGKRFKKDASALIPE